MELPNRVGCNLIRVGSVLFDADQATALSVVLLLDAAKPLATWSYSICASLAMSKPWLDVLVVVAVLLLLAACDTRSVSFFAKASDSLLLTLPLLSVSMALNRACTGSLLIFPARRSVSDTVPS